MIWRISKTLALDYITSESWSLLRYKGTFLYVILCCIRGGSIFKGIKVSLEFSSFPSTFACVFHFEFPLLAGAPLFRVQMDALYSRKKKKKCGQSNRGESCWLHGTRPCFLSFFFFFLKKYFHPPSVIDRKRPRRPTYVRASRWPSHVMAALSPHVVTRAPTSPSTVFFFSKRDCTSKCCTFTSPWTMCPRRPPNDVSQVDRSKEMCMIFKSNWTVVAPLVPHIHPTCCCLSAVDGLYISNITTKKQKLTLFLRRRAHIIRWRDTRHG